MARHNPMEREMWGFALKMCESVTQKAQEIIEHDLPVSTWANATGLKVRNLNSGQSAVLTTAGWPLFSLPPGLYHPTTTSKVFGLLQETSLEYPPESSYGNAYCWPLIAIEWKNFA
jgi:hypothetical protein